MDFYGYKVFDILCEMVPGYLQLEGEKLKMYTEVVALAAATHIRQRDIAKMPTDQLKWDSKNIQIQQKKGKKSVNRKRGTKHK